MKLAEIVKIKSVINHPNADRLDIVTVLGDYKCIVGKDVFKKDELAVFINPDTTLPNTEWTNIYNKTGKKDRIRVKAIKLRDQWSFGIVEHISLLPTGVYNEGDDISEILDIQKYTPPEPSDLSAKGNMPFNIPKTDETRYQSLSSDEIPYNKNVIITQKIDGKSATFYAAYDLIDQSWHTGITSRQLELKLDCTNEFTYVNKKYNILDKLLAFCQKQNVSLALRGELTGGSIQKFSINPSTGGEYKWNMFSVYNITKGSYERFNNPYFFTKIANELDLPIVPILQECILTPDIIKYYDEEIIELNGKPFEGVVIQHENGSFKIINKFYDSKK